MWDVYPMWGRGGGLSCLAQGRPTGTTSLTRGRRRGGVREKSEQTYPRERGRSMPEFMDVHTGMAGITPEGLMEAHNADLAIQDDEKVNFKHAWADPESGMVFCLSEAPPACTAMLPPSPEIMKTCPWTCTTSRPSSGAEARAARAADSGSDTLCGESVCARSDAGAGQTAAIQPALRHNEHNTFLIARLATSPRPGNRGTSSPSAASAGNTASRARCPDAASECPLRRS